MNTRRVLNREEIVGLVKEWRYAQAAGEEVEPLQSYLGFTEEEMDRWEHTKEPPYDVAPRIPTQRSGEYDDGRR
jgi:hypothetical protein